MSGETENQVSGWTVDTLHSHIQQQFMQLNRMLDERYSTQTKAVDAAFLAQQTAMQTALASAEKAVATALLAAEKAVTKAELAAEKRFDLMNEFRGQLADQAATFMPRSESEVRIERNSERITELADRINKNEGKDSGKDAARALFISGLIILVAIIGVIVAIVL